MRGIALLRHIAWLLLLPLAAAHAAGKPAADLYRFGAVPAWIETQKAQYDAPNPADSSGGTWYLLFDRQIDIRDDGDDEYTHMAIKVMNAEGVKSESQFDIQVDPAYERLEIHNLRVIRDGRVIDCRKTTRITALAMEKEIEEHIYNGAYNVNLLLPDIRPGDILEYDYTIHTREWLMPGHFARRMDVSWSVPMLWQRVRLRYPSGRALQYRFNTQPVEPVRRSDGAHTELSFRWDNPAVVPSDKDRPGWAQPWSILTLSDVPDWSSVAKNVTGLFTLKERPRPNLDAALAALRQSPGTPEQQVMRTLRYVQGEIRYTSISIARGSYTPSDPETTLERRFGDCKDKSLLLATLLRRQGIDAVPVLVNTRRGKTLQQDLPTPYIFDHAIVRARLGGAVYWLDGTRYPQWQALATLAPPEFAWALPIAADTTALESIPQPAADSDNREVRVDFDFSKGIHEPPAMDVVTRYAGQAADSMRGRLGQQSDSERQTSYLNYYARYYPGIRVAKPLIVNDDTAADTLEIHEHYILDQGFTAKDDGKETFTTRTDEFYGYAGTLKSSVRNSPLAVDYPDHTRQVVTVHLPDEWDVKDDETHIDDPAFRYSSRISRKGKAVTQEYDYLALSDHVDVADIARYQADRSRLNEDLDYRFTHTPPAPRSAQEKAKPADAPLAIAPAPLLVALLALGLGTWLTIRYLYPYDPLPRPAPASSPKGIEGWLLLPALRAVAGPLVLLYIVGQFGRFADASMWQVLPTIVKASYADWARPLLLILMALGGLLLPASVALAVLFFRKRTSTPAVFVAFLVALELYNVLVVGVVASSGIKDAGSEKDVAQALASGVIAVAIWSAYMLQSVRVKATFVNRLHPVPPPLPVAAVNSETG